jgi:hypothetical protein
MLRDGVSLTAGCSATIDQGRPAHVGHPSLTEDRDEIGRYFKIMSPAESSESPKGSNPLLITQFIGIPLCLVVGLFIYFQWHAAVGLAIAILGSAFSLLNIAMIKWSGRRLTNPGTRAEQRTGETLSPVTALALPSGRWVGAADVPGGMGRMNASTPLAVLELDDHCLTLRVRPRFLSRLFGVHSLSLTPSDVELIFPARGRLRSRAVGIRPTRQPPSYFLLSDRSAILSAVAQAGFPVDWEEHRYSYS